MKHPLEGFGARKATVFELLNLSGPQRTREIHALALERQVHPATVYRWLAEARKANGLGCGRLPRSDRGEIARPGERLRILNYVKTHPGVSGPEIKKALRLKYSVASINRIVRTSRIRKYC